MTSPTVTACDSASVVRPTVVEKRRVGPAPGSVPGPTWDSSAVASRTTPTIR